MCVLTQALVFLTLMPASALQAASQTASQPNSGGSIAGRVTLAGQPAANIPVTLRASPGAADVAIGGISGMTDADGRFRLTLVPAGTFFVTAYAPALYSEKPGGEARTVTLTNGESVEGIDIALRQGGAITGRITDPSGRPLIGENISLYLVDRDGNKSQYFPTRPTRMMITDDLGIYRIYGLPPGRYLVGAGSSSEPGAVHPGAGSSFSLRTYYPGVSEPSGAEQVEVTEAGEAAGIDIVLGRTAKAFTVTGRVIDGDTGKPLPGVACGYGKLISQTGHLDGMTFGGIANTRGEFRINSVVPGKYVAILMSSSVESQNYIYDPAPFEIRESNVSGVEIRLRRGASISGTVSVEGKTPGTNAQLEGLRLIVNLPSGIIPVHFSQVNTDGSFYAGGLPPGKAKVTLAGFAGARRCTLVRVERDGITATDGLDVAAGENVTGIRVVVAIGNGVIRGEIKFGEGPLLAGLRVFISAHQIGYAAGQRSWGTEGDARGHFVIDSLIPGEYEITAHVNAVDGNRSIPVPNLRCASRTVKVTNEAETPVTLIVESTGQSK